MRYTTDLETFAEEVSAVCDKKTLLALYNAATEEPFSFLYAKLTAKNQEDTFYKNFDHKLLVESDDPLDAIHRADLKLDLEEKLHLPLDIIFLEKGKKRTAFQELAYSRSGLL